MSAQGEIPPGSLKINEGEPAVGRAAITAAANGHGLIASSLGHFDAADYQRQLEVGIEGDP